MKLNELKIKLEELNIPKDAYCLEGGLPDETCCIGKNGLRWEVYYSERGHQNNLKGFDTETEACDYFYEMVVGGLKKMEQFKYLFE